MYEEVFCVDHLEMCYHLVLIYIFFPQDDKDSDSSKEALDDLFPNDDDDQGPGSKEHVDCIGRHLEHIMTCMNLCDRQYAGPHQALVPRGLCTQ